MGHPDFINAGGVGPDVSQGGQWDMAHSKQFHLGEIDPFGTPEDAHGHGTHVAGIALASGNNGAFDNHGVIGMGYNCKGMMLRVFDNAGVGTDADAGAAMFYAADNGADIISISLGTENFSQLFQDAVNYAFQKGSLVVAAGNEDGNGGGDLGPIYPAACTSAIGVSANGPGQYPALSTYSGFGYYVDIAAPGGDVFIDFASLSYTIQFIWSTAMRTVGSLNQNPDLYPPYSLNYCYLAGTSMATPGVSGAAGLYYGKNNIRQTDGWSNVRALRALESSAEGLMGAPYGGREDVQGYGSLDVDALMTNLITRDTQVGGIKGMVYYNATPVGNTQVRAQKITGGTIFSTTTHADGSYRVEALPAGVYRVTTAPFGALKGKNIEVTVGSDVVGVDFYAGTFTWDETDPTIARVQVSNVQQSSITVRHWAYDPETCIDLMQFRIGTTQGGNDVMADKEVFSTSPVVQLTGLNLQPGGTYWLRAHYVSGSNRIADMDVQIQAGAATNVPPTSYTLQRGLPISGGLANMITSDDTRMVARNGLIAASSESPITIQIDGVSPVATASDLKLKLEAQTSTTSLKQTLDMWDWQASTWVTLDQRTATTSDQTVTVTTTSPNRFIQPGTRVLRARVRYKVFAPLLSSIWQGRIDQIQWQVTP
jgi:subtilisin family serine protease